MPDTKVCPKRRVAKLKASPSWLTTDVDHIVSLQGENVWPTRSLESSSPTFGHKYMKK